MKFQNIPTDKQVKEGQPAPLYRPEHPTSSGSLPTASWLPSQFDKVSAAGLLRRLRLGWQSAPAIRGWNALADFVLAGLRGQEFNAESWIATNLDLLRPPVPERDTPLLTALSVKELKQLYNTLSTMPASPVWQDYVWDTLTDMVEREFALEL